MFHTFKVGYRGDAMKWDISIGETVCNFSRKPNDTIRSKWGKITPVPKPNE